MTELLQKLSSVCAPSGKEKAVAEVIEKEIAPYCDSVSYDKIGNMTAVIKPRKKCEKVMLCAHMDEVGFMVKNIDSDGRAHIVLLGAVETRTLSGRKVRFLNGTTGIVTTKPIHVLSEAEVGRTSPADKIFVEIGAKDKTEAAQYIKIGDFGTFEPKFTEMANETYAGKAVGGRACVSTMIELIKEAHAAKKAKTLKKECYFVFSVKREIAIRSFFAVETAAFHIEPNKALVLDTAPVCDFLKEELMTGAKCGGGIVLAPADIRTIYNRELFADAVKLCEKKGIAYQNPTFADLPGGEGGAIHQNGGGVPTLSVGIPTRNLHSGAEIVKAHDMRAATAFLREWLISDQ
ncbi:MAG: hypothetical protein IJ489_06320 [Clostridia bacterium]|nr:hypothetical protein [Clostridia bacterium]